MGSLVIENAAILADAAGTFLERGDILVEDGRITAVGVVDPAAKARASKRIAGDGFLAAPGLVNAHMHSPGAFSAGTQDAASHPAFMWLNQADTGGRTPREVYVSAMLSATQMLLSGTTTAIDHFPAQNFGPEDLAAAAEAWDDAGMRMVLAVRIFDDDFGDIFPADKPLPDDLKRDLERIKPLPPKPLNETQAIVEDAVRRYHRPEGRLSVFPAPTNPVRCSDDLLVMTREIAEKYDVGIHTHLLESQVQTVLAQKRYGRTMTQHLERLGLLSARLSCAHTIWIEQEDIERLAAHGVVVVHNPESNLKLGTGIAPIRAMLDAGVTVALGTDGSVTNDNLVMHEGIRLAAMLNRTSTRDRARWITAPEVFGMATDGGAKAVQLAGQVGRLAPGYRADIVLYDLDTPQWTPVNEPLQQMVFAETGSSVDTVIVGGEVVVAGGEITAFDAKAVIAEAKPMLAAIRRRNADLYRFARRMADIFP